MLTKLNSIQVLKTMIKLSAVALTSPATVAVAGSLYPENPFTRVTVSIAALVLVEDCLLLGWQMLDSHGKNTNMPQRWLYAGLAWVAYFALFGIALFHKEGVAGLAFRLTLGVMLVYASAEAGLLASAKTQKQADKDILKDWRVKRHARKVARQSAMADLDLTVKMRQLDRDAQEELYTLRRQYETQQKVLLIESNVASDTVEVVEMAKFDTSTLAHRPTSDGVCRKWKPRTGLYNFWLRTLTSARQKSGSRSVALGKQFMTIWANWRPKARLVGTEMVFASKMTDCDILWYLIERITEPHQLRCGSLSANRISNQMLSPAKSAVPESR